MAVSLFALVMPLCVWPLIAQRTSLIAPRMSAFEAKADVAGFRSYSIFSHR
jgi:hypothetical protein